MIISPMIIVTGLKPALLADGIIEGHSGIKTALKTLDEVDDFFKNREG